MKDKIRVALIQPKPYPHRDDPQNLGHALSLLEKCRGEELDVACFPEYFPYLGEDELGAAARQYQTYLIAGLVETEGGKLYNTATLFDRFGRLLGRQRKRNVTALEVKQLGISPSDGSYRALPTDFGKIGMLVGSDFWGQPEGAKQLADQGADLIFNISVFPLLRGHWKEAAGVRAFDNFMPMVGVNTADYNAILAGKRVHHHGGHSFVIQPPRMIGKDDYRRWYRALDSVADWTRVELEELEQVQIAEINLSSTRRFRKEFWDGLGFRRM